MYKKHNFVKRNHGTRICIVETYTGLHVVTTPCAIGSLQDTHFTYGIGDITRRSISITFKLGFCRNAKECKA